MTNILESGIGSQIIKKSVEVRKLKGLNRIDTKLINLVWIVLG
jgi:hypothetical protein